MQHQQLKRLLSQRQRVVIVLHHRPDGDALGSGLALARLCRVRGHQVAVVSPTACPRFLDFLDGVGDVVVASEAWEQAVGLIDAAELILCVDFSAYERLGDLARVVRASRGVKVVIDHHPGAEAMGELLIRDTTAPATAMLLYQLWVAMGWEADLDPVAVEALYVGLLTDTGHFIHGNTTAAAHQVAASMIAKGIDVGRVSHMLYRRNSLKGLQFIAYAVRYRLVVSLPHRYAYFAIPRRDFKKFGVASGETFGLVNFALNLAGVSIAVLLTEQPKAPPVRLSFRSLGDVAINRFAAQHFQGGGHKNAAGGISPLPMEETVARLERLLVQAFAA